MTKRILLIDDDIELAQLFLQSFAHKGFEVFSALDGQEGLRAAFQLHPDLVVLDIMMPEMDGWQTCKRLREVSNVPIIILTAISSQNDIIQGFQLGVDDYIAKPFDSKELELRIHAVLRRAEEHRDKRSLALYDDGKLKIDLEHRQVFLNGKIVHLTATEFRLLECFVQNEGCLVPHKHLLQEVWGATDLDGMASLALYIHYLRTKIEDDPQNPQYILTEWGLGYRFVPASSQELLPT